MIDLYEDERRRRDGVWWLKKKIRGVASPYNEI